LSCKCRTIAGGTLMENTLPAHLIIADIAAHDAADAGQTAALRATDKGRLNQPNELIFVKRHHSTRLQQTVESRKMSPTCTAEKLLSGKPDTM